jgi:recombination protein RecT
MMSANLVPANVKEIGTMLDRYQDQVGKALAGKIPTDYFLQCAATALRRDPSMMSKECQPSLMAALFQSAQCHLPIGDGTQRACLVRYGREVQFQTMYQGLIDIAYRSGQIKDICAEVVYEEDEFEFELGTKARIVHRPKFGGDKDMTKYLGCYAIAHTLQGGIVVELMDRKQIEGIKARSKAFQRGSGPWCTDEPEMCKKTVLRRLCKKLPKSIFPIAVHAALEQEDARDFRNAREAEIVVKHPAPVPEGEPEPPKPKGKTKKAEAPADVKSAREAVKELTKSMDPAELDAVMFAAGFEGSIDTCEDIEQLKALYATAEKSVVEG